MPKAFPIEFRRDVVAVARKGEASLAQIAKDFGISESCLNRWLKLADIEEGVRPVEGMWSAIKGKDLANYAATDLTDLWHAAHRGLQRIRRNPALLWSFLAATDLTISPT